MQNYLAQVQRNIGTPLNGLGPLGNPGANAPTLFNRFLTGVIGIMTAIAAIWFVILFITGAIGIVTSGGDKGSLEAAKNKFTSGVVGLVVVIGAIFLIDIIGRLLGIDLILDPGAFINNFTF